MLIEIEEAQRQKIARMFEDGRWLLVELGPENCEFEIDVADKRGEAPCRFPCRRVSDI